MPFCLMHVISTLLMFETGCVLLEKTIMIGIIFGILNGRLIKASENRRDVMTSSYSRIRKDILFILSGSLCSHPQLSDFYCNPINMHFCFLTNISTIHNSNDT